MGLCEEEATGNKSVTHQWECTLPVSSQSAWIGVDSKDSTHREGIGSVRDEKTRLYPQGNKLQALVGQSREEHSPFPPHHLLQQHLTACQRTGIAEPMKGGGSHLMACILCNQGRLRSRCSQRGGDILQGWGGEEGRGREWADTRQLTTECSNGM